MFDNNYETATLYLPKLFMPRGKPEESGSLAPRPPEVRGAARPDKGPVPVDPQTRS